MLYSGIIWIFSALLWTSNLIRVIIDPPKSNTVTILSMATLIFLMLVLGITNLIEARQKKKLSEKSKYEKTSTHREN